MATSRRATTRSTSIATSAVPDPGTRPSGDDPTAIVVGAGVFGVAVADSLVRRGWDVTVVEQYAPANARGSSGDRTRLLRLGHGEGDEEHDLYYIRSAARGIALWKALSEAADDPLLTRTGLVWLAGEHDGLEHRVAGRMELAGAPFERITPSDTRALFPSLAVDDLAFSLYEPEAYVIRATAAVEALLRRARHGGARLIGDRARPAGPHAVQLTDGARSADRVVWACGAWMGALFPREAPVRASWQDVLHWNTPPGWSTAPAWFDERVNLYGFPDVDGLGIKAVTHRPGRTFDPDRDARVPEPSMTEQVARYIGRRFPSLAGAGVLWARVMPYEMTPDSHFIAGPAELDGHWLLGGGSGHGFKHAPALGEHIADLVEGKADVVPMLRPGPREP